mgnify:CR=1 FL=1
MATMSSILRMEQTVSVAREMALVETKSGWTTFSSKMFEIVPCARVLQRHATPY